MSKINTAVKLMKGTAKTATSSVLARPKVPMDVIISAKKGLKYVPVQNKPLTVVNSLRSRVVDFSTGEVAKICLADTPFAKKSSEELIALASGKSSSQKELLDSFHLLRERFMHYIFQKAPDIRAVEIKRIEKLGAVFTKAEHDFLSLFDLALFKPSTDRQVIEIEQELAKMGIDARLSDQKNVAKSLLEACKKMKQAGVESFPKYRVCGAKQGGNAINGATVSDSYVILNSLDKAIKAKEGYFAVPTVEGLIYHETAHVLNSNLTIADSILMTSMLSDFSKYIAMIKKYVSEYGTNNKNEACSEIFAGLMSKKVYPKEVMKALKVFGGVKPSWA